MNKSLIINLFSPFEWFLILGVISTSLAYSLYMNQFDALGFIAGLSGVLCVVLVAKRNMLNYVFGIINVSLYAYISFKSLLYGDAALNALYYLPMQFIGWFMWSKRTVNAAKNNKQDRDTKEEISIATQTVISKKMNTKERVLLGIFCIGITLLGGYILATFTQDPQPYKDSATTILSIIAMFLMVKTYTEQWALWIIVNTISIIMWTLLLIDGDFRAGLMIAMWIFYLANSINGLITWSKAAA